MTRDGPMCGATVNSGHSCPECSGGQSDGTAVKEVATDGADANAPPSDDGHLPADLWVTIGAGVTSLAAGAVGYMSTYLYWESEFPFPIISLITFAYLIQMESGKKAVGTGLYIISALLILW